MAVVTELGSSTAEAVEALAQMGGASLVAADRVPDGPGWLRLSDLADDPDVLGEWVARAARRHGGPDVAASYLTIWLGWPLARTLLGPALTTDRALLATPATVWLHPHPHGWIDAVALEAPTLALCATDPLLTAQSSVPLVTVARDGAALRAAAVNSLVGVMAPVIAALRAYTRRGRYALWGGVVDACARLVADAAGREATRDAVAAAIDALLSAADPPLKARPRVLDCGVGTGLSFSVCCLGDRDPSRGHVLCAGCPKRTEADMTARLAALLR
jgi:hypothetical protein